LFLLAASTAWAQHEQTRLYSQPAVPPTEVLDRLNLKLAWRTYITTDGRKDGLLSVQFVGDQLLVQNRSGLVSAVDAATGHVQWRTAVGQAYFVVAGLGSNSRSVFAISSNVLYALDRRTGLPQWSFELPAGAATAPVADEDEIYLSLGTGRLYTYFLPQPTPPGLVKPGTSDKPGARPLDPGPLGAKSFAGGTTYAAIGPLSGSREAGLAEELGPRPLLLWDHITKGHLEQPPIVFGQSLFIADTSGTVTGLAREANFELSRFPTDGNVAVPLGQHTDAAYIASQDGNVYALRFETGRLLWRYTTGALFTHRPWATDDDVYVTAQGTGLCRVDRATGDERWRQKGAVRFLAANPKFVYATDFCGMLVVLDRARGKVLSQYNTRDFVVPVSNDLTDRLFLAANNGLIVCLHDKQYAKPLVSKKLEAMAVKPVKAAPADEKSLQQMKTKLAAPIRLEIEDPKTTFKEVLEVISDLHKLKIEVPSDEELKKQSLEPFLDKVVKVPLRFDNVSLGDALRQLLGQVNLTIAVRPDHVLVVPLAR
jgi:outer membrane protein assembly factor BamB